MRLGFGFAPALVRQPKSGGGGGDTPPPAPPSLQTEDGADLLLEDSGLIILE